MTTRTRLAALQFGCHTSRKNAHPHCTAAIWFDPQRFEVVDPQMVEILRTKTPDEKLAMADGLRRMARDLIRDGLRHDHLDWSQDQLAAETARRMSRGTLTGP